VLDFYSVLYINKLQIFMLQTIFLIFIY